MDDNTKEIPKIEVKVSAKLTVPFWTAGWLYTLGVLFTMPESQEWLASWLALQPPWHEVVFIGIGSYMIWPFLLGFYG